MEQKIKADASMTSNRTESGLKKDIKIYFKEADQEDAREGRLRRLKEAQEESTGKKKRGRKPRSAEQVEKEETENLKANIIDSDSRIMKTRKAQKDDKIIPLPLTTVSTMEYKLLTPEGRKLYKKHSARIEPVFGHIKEVLGFNRFMRRGLEACNCEWKMICSAYNLLKLWWYGIDKVHKKIRENLAIIPSEKQVTYALAVKQLLFE